MKRPWSYREQQETKWKRSLENEKYHLIRLNLFLTAIQVQKYWDNSLSGSHTLASVPSVPVLPGGVQLFPQSPADRSNRVVETETTD